jgi:hypothetical protein
MVVLKKEGSIDENEKGEVLLWEKEVWLNIT